MELEKDTFSALIEYLIQHGYPQESLVTEYPLGKYRADLAVVDPHSKEPIALFKIKQRRTPNTERMGRKQLQSFLSALGIKSIPTYLVFVKDDSPPFEIERVFTEERKVQEDEELSPSKELLNYGTLQQMAPNAIFAETKQKRKRAIEALSAVCISITAILIVLLCLDAVGLLSITPIHLTIGGVIIALILIPFASRVKIWGIEFDRRKKED